MSHSSKREMKAQLVVMDMGQTSFLRQYTSAGKTSPPDAGPLCITILSNIHDSVGA